MHVRVGYPGGDAERQILALVRGEAEAGDAVPASLVSQQTIFDARDAVLKLHMAEPVEDYLVNLVLATRGGAGPSLEQWLEFGASPRATIALDRCARAHAWLQDKEFVTPDDVQAVAHDVLRHRLILSFEAEASGITPDKVIDELLETVAVG